MDDKARRGSGSLNQKGKSRQLLGVMEVRKEGKGLASHGKVDLLKTDFVSLAILRQASYIQMCVKRSLVHIWDM